MNMTVFYNDCDVNDPECFSPDTVEPWETDFAPLVPRFSGSISAICSSLIIYVILRSERRLSSIYHRIMFGMSFADICGSLAISLTSLPMPSYMPKEEVFGYHWTGTRLGNTYTCNAQGFFAMFGMGCMFNYIGMLCVYYACAIAFTMRERYIQKYVEPFLHGYPILSALAISLPPLFYDMYNPGVTAYAWCGPFPYPDECAVLEDVECIRGNANVRDTIQFLLPTSIVILLFNIIVPLTLVIRKVIQTDRVLQQISDIYREYGREDMQRVVEKHHNTKAVLIQASSYIAAFFLCIFPPMIMSLGIFDVNEKRGKTVTVIFTKLFLVFYPLGGFFNFLIFISHKVYNYRRIHEDARICHVLGLLFCTSAHDPFFISRISILQQYEDEEEDCEGAVVEECCEVKIRDESNEELCFRLGLLLSPHTTYNEGLSVPGEIEDENTGDGHEGRAMSPFTFEDDSSRDHSTIAQEQGDHCHHYHVISSPLHQDEVDENGSARLNSCDDKSSMLSYSSRPSLNISIRDTALSIAEEYGGDQEKYYYRDVKFK